MSNRLFDRLTTLLKADAHGVVESLEERSLLLKQYLREAEIELDRKRARLEALRDDEKRLRETLARREGELRGLDEDVALALSRGKEEIARFAIRKLLPRRSVVTALRSEIDERAEEARALSEKVEAQRALFDDLRTRVRAELARDPDATCASPFSADLPVADEEVELEMMRRRPAAEEAGR